MHNHTSIELLKTLNQEELKKLKDYISSPYFNKSETLVKLFEIILKQAPDFNSRQLQKEKLYNKLYPGKSYNEQTIRSRMVELTSLIKGYFTLTGIEKDEFILKKTLIKEYRSRQKFELADKLIKETFNKLEEAGIYNLDYFRDTVELLNQQTKLFIARDMKPEALKLGYKRGELSMNYFVNHLLQMNDELVKNKIEHKEITGINYIELLFGKFDIAGLLGELEKMNYKHYPFLAINYYANLSISDPEDENNFFKLKELIYNNYKNFSLNTVYNYWSMLSNAVIINYLNKGSKFLYEGHEINKFFIDNRLFDPAKPLSAHAYQNTVVNALLVKDIEWCDKFIEEFKHLLTGDARENRYNFCKAMVLFEKKEYDSSISFLNKVKHADWHFKITVRIYFLKNYFELGLHEQLHSLLDSLKHMIADNSELPGYVDERINKSLYYIGKIAGAKFDGKKLDDADLMEAEKIKYYNHKEWIIEKMKELLNN